jgi:mlo protein
MGSKYKAALIPNRIRETMHGWGKDARKRRRKRRGDDSTIRTETSTVCSLDYEDDDDHDEDATPPRLPPYLKIELRPMHGGGGIPRPGTPSHHLPIGMLPGSSSTPHGSSQHALLQRQASSSASAPSSPPRSSHGRGVTRSASMPGIASLATPGAGYARHWHSGSPE